MVHYPKGHVKSVLDAIGVTVVASTAKRYNCLCPFHRNTDTPAFSISREEGVWICFNESCAETGNLPQLVQRLTDRTEMEALRFINMRGEAVNDRSLSEILDDAFAPKQEWPHFPQQVVDQLVKNFWLTPKAQDYMHGRGFTDDTLRFFEIGFSPKMGGQVTYPVHTPNGDQCVGVVGRGVSKKFFDNSKSLPKKDVLYNLHNARRHSSSVIVVESGFDAQRIHQAGFPNTVATLGSSLGNEQIELMERNFTDIIVFSDNDDAGMSMRKHIMDRTKTAAVLHAAWDYDTLFPTEGISAGVPKDAGDLSVEQIKHMVNNPLTSYEAGIP